MLINFRLILWLLKNVRNSGELNFKQRSKCTEITYYDQTIIRNIIQTQNMRSELPQSLRELQTNRTP